jgi:cytochrome c peroxidase
MQSRDLFVSFALLACVGCGGGSPRGNTVKAVAARPVSPPAALAFNPRLLRRFSPVRPVLAADPATVTDARVALGRMLFYDPRLSRSGKLSCNSCHALDQYGVDGLRTARGHRGLSGRRNSPTVYHAAGYAAQFWDGRARDVEAQARGPILDPGEMAMPSPAAVDAVLRSIPDYRAAFARAFPGPGEPATLDHAAAAIGAFERRLVTPSRWDRYLGGDRSALVPQEVEGLKAFTNLGCMVCHTGEMLGGQSFQKVGSVEPWPNQKDQGRFEITHHVEDRMMFRVPTLRNIERTAPYFHDGSTASLDEAVRMMGKHQLGLELADREVASIVAWLKCLTGPLPDAYIARPSLPRGTAGTPGPDPT